MQANILITGDLVLDHHLYEGDRPEPQERQQIALEEVIEWGGANLLCSLLKATESEPPPIHTALSFGAMPRPDIPVDRHLPIGVAHGYALFSPMQRNAEDESLVWRVSKVLGYGRSEEAGASLASLASFPKPEILKTQTVICLDDAGSEFRNLYSQDQQIWCLPPENASDSEKGVPQPWVVLKLSGDLEHGRLWPELERRVDLHQKMVIIIAAQTLRNMNVRLSTGLSWERSLEHLIFELMHNPALRRLKIARHLIVHFDIDAAVWIRDFTSDHPQVLLVFDAAHAEGEWAETFKGNAFAYQTCLAAAVCRRLAIAELNKETLDIAAMTEAIGAGLATMRLLRSDGHGAKADKLENLSAPDGFPIPALACELLKPSQTFSHVVVPNSVWETAKQHPDSHWTILSQTQNPDETNIPLYGLARQIVLRGEIALRRVPHLRIGKLLTTARTDMEGLRALRRLFNAYKDGSTKAKRPLSIGVFGPPGAGKSFAVKELTVGIFAPGEKEYAGWREFNLSQFGSIEDLIGAFHQVRDLVLQGLIPVVFWDEFDSSKYKWLQYLLAPMQDGRFQQGEATHTIGKCIFIFAGGTAWTFDSFGESTVKEDSNHFRLAKGPDFKSRLDGIYDVLGPNQRLIPPKDSNGEQKHTAPAEEWQPDQEDIYFPIRRAIMIRGVMRAKPDERLEFDPGLLTALLETDSYIHGARSLEKVLESLIQRKNLLQQTLRPIRASLPAPSQLRLHVRNPEVFHQLCSEDIPAFVLNENTIQQLAQAIHADWRDRIHAERQQNDNDKPWEQLPNDIKESNISAAHRIPGVLSLVGLRLVPGDATTEELNQVRDYLALHLDLLAEDEHDRWMAAQKAIGVSYGETRDQSHHPCMKPFQQLPLIEQKKDREAVMHYPHLARLMGHKLAFVAGSSERRQRKKDTKSS